MKKKIGLSLIVSLLVSSVFGQTLTDTQMRNARATGYAIVASRNPGKSFSVYVIPWDGVHTLEYNANTQINSGWHPQAVVKGNYFTQSFDGTDFTQYSTVILSQQEFDQYKSVGTQWWIVCSTLTSFSNSSISVATNGNVGINTPIPNFPLDVFGDVNLDDGGTNRDLKIRLHQKSALSSFNTRNSPNDILYLNRNWSSSGYFSDFNTVSIYGNVGIGTELPDAKLAVSGQVHAQEVKVSVNVPGPDYVFDKNYKLSTLEELKAYIDHNKHLPEVPTAAEMEKNGVLLGEMNMVLLKKVEELTLYVMAQQKQLEKQQAVIDQLVLNK